MADDEVEKADDLEIRVEVPADTVDTVKRPRKSRVRVQVSLYGQQGERFLKMKEESGLTSSQFASVLIMIGLRYIWSVMYPSESLSDDVIDKLAAAFSKYVVKE